MLMTVEHCAHTIQIVATIHCVYNVYVAEAAMADDNDDSALLFWNAINQKKIIQWWSMAISRRKMYTSNRFIAHFADPDFVHVDHNELVFCMALIENDDQASAAAAQYLYEWRLSIINRR